MKSFLLLIAVAVCAGLIVAWMPYGQSFLFVFYGLSAVYVLVYVLSGDFRESNSSGFLFNALVAFWIVIGIYSIRPAGLDTLLPEMHDKEMKVSQLIDVIESETGNVRISCPEDIGRRVVVYNTITGVTVAESLALLRRKTDISFRYARNKRGASIANGPGIDVELFIGEDDARDSYYYDGAIPYERE